MDRPPSRSRAPMSMEALLDEENREVLAALDRKRPSSPIPRFKPPRTATPPPVRSMLDVDSPIPRHGSIAGIGVGVTSPNSSRKPAKELDPSDPSSWTSPHSSKPSSPVLTKTSPAITRQRNSSETERPVGLPKIQTDEKRGFEQNYQFDISSIPSSSPASRSPPNTKRPREGSGSAMAAALSGDFASLHVGVPGGGHGRHNSTVAAGASSRSPSSRIRKPEPSRPGFLSPTSTPGPLTTKSGTVVDDQAHLRLSSGSFSTTTDDSEEGLGRINKDSVAGEEDAVDDSDEDVISPSSDEDETRGRSERRKLSANHEPADAKALDTNGASSPEDLKRTSHSKQFVRSLLEPSISITSPTGENVTDKKGGSSTPIRRSSVTSVEDDDEENAAIRKAKTLALNISPLDSTVTDRHVRIILRGNWAHFYQESEAGKRTARLYLLCSDQSVEASYAMEWVVGTMMRDGDTLLAIYAMEDENAGKTTEAEKEVLTAEGNKAGRDASDVMHTLTRQTTQGGGTSFGLGKESQYVPATEIESLTGSVDARKVSKKEMDRLKAVESLTQDFVKLVRKTPLQVRCMVEVIHCKSPKHLILGAIDELEPTLCVVGTRGRSSLKGVLLGSFSNYLVTKSSVPVMVARKRMKKPHSNIRISSSKIRLSNNLTASHLPTKRRTLTQARID
ncbi:uncharacterized protein Z519_05618 [Cladophialophora bantiana CBS 173.52]|uniref:UspA domain-containing protein n=1 Tax=Cladophialophora bantiana (strain ATCC 10958 / CBS 173.52 / CDC B-1940 / NIH 8579) TaxID=1442370 RepID=A0A0D2G6R1_CLAB1|nr:uncharacterized protein Z519_05618 [Cladophialophora bantiana CBS 173.52]KIW94302.1 hypothetical protein Z519_05618 [Cladophialophora bantiana CBS 173.52]